MKLKKSGDNGGYWLSRSAAKPVSSSLGWGFIRDAGPLRYQCVRRRKRSICDPDVFAEKIPPRLKKPGGQKEEKVTAGPLESPGGFLLVKGLLHINRKRAVTHCAL